MIVCVHGKQMVPAGERGVYFICQLKEAYLGNHCRYVRWCAKENHYEAQMDKNGNMCKFFSTQKPEVAKSVSKPKDKVVTKAEIKSKTSDKMDVSSEEKSEDKNTSKVLKEKDKE
jgi:hypothetical protein